ncbi:MAG TPA: serine hydrolase domain-containing protein [Bacteroidia bacterium]|jgi:CubicO group peptidase (beta-lactamase class C family)|nr:serine hydrolase domain-containing protein [Bacteroidia bacterium]
MRKRYIYHFLIALGAIGALYFSFGSTISQGEPDLAIAKKVEKKKDTAVHIVKVKDTAIALSAIEQCEEYRIDSFFNRLSKLQRFNGNVLVAHDGKVLYQQCFGVTDFKHKNPLTDSSEFQLGSVSKQFTSVAIMMLKEQGKLDYSDSVQKFFPAFPYKGVTVEMLLDHRSGLPNYMYLCSSLCKTEDQMVDNMQVVNLLCEHKPQRYFAPDKRFNYSNTNYCVLAAIVEQVSGVKFSDFMRKNVFKPLGMNHTFIYDKTDTVIPNRVTGYNANYKKSGIDFLDGVAGDKGVYSTTGDLLKWDQALYTDKLLKQSTLYVAYQPHGRWLNMHNYGFGWWLAYYNKDILVYHDGWWHGFNCAFLRDIKGHNTIIVLSNHVNWCINQSRELLTLLRTAADSEDEKTTASVKLFKK